MLTVLIQTVKMSSSSSNALNPQKRALWILKSTFWIKCHAHSGSNAILSAGTKWVIRKISWYSMLNRH